MRTHLAMGKNTACFFFTVGSELAMDCRIFLPHYLTTAATFLTDILVQEQCLGRVIANDIQFYKRFLQLLITAVVYQLEVFEEKVKINGRNQGRLVANFEERDKKLAMKFEIGLGHLQPCSNLGTEQMHRCGDCEYLTASVHGYRRLIFPTIDQLTQPSSLPADFGLNLTIPAIFVHSFRLCSAQLHLVRFSHSSLWVNEERTTTGYLKTIFTHRSSQYF